MKNNSWSNFTSGLIGAIIGSLISLTPYLRDEYCIQPDVKGKIKGIIVSPKIDSLVLLDKIPDTYNTYRGSRYLFNLSMTSLHKDKIFSKVEAFIKFNDDKIEKGIIYYVRNDTLLKKDKSIQFLSTFPKDVATQCYLNILIKDKFFNNANEMGFKELIMDFHDYNDNVKRTIIKAEDIDSKSIISTLE